MNEREKFLFDLQGFLVLEEVLPPNLLHQLNKSIDSLKKNLSKPPEKWKSSSKPEDFRPAWPSHAI